MSRYEDLKRMVIAHRNSDECLIWPYARTSRYGHLTKDNEQRRVHILSYEIFISPDHQFVLHTCDNGFCFNPKHLWSGTQRDNMQDCIKKGRFIRRGGLEHWRARDTSQYELRAMAREMYAKGDKSMREVAEALGTTKAIVYKAINRLNSTEK